MKVSIWCVAVLCSTLTYAEERTRTFEEDGRGRSRTTFTLSGGLHGNVVELSTGAPLTDSTGSATLSVDSRTFTISEWDLNHRQGDWSRQETVHFVDEVKNEGIGTMTIRVRVDAFSLQLPGTHVFPLTDGDEAHTIGWPTTDWEMPATLSGDWIANGDVEIQGRWEVPVVYVPPPAGTHFANVNVAGRAAEVTLFSGGYWWLDGELDIPIVNGEFSGVLSYGGTHGSSIMAPEPSGRIVATALMAAALGWWATFRNAAR